MARNTKGYFDAVLCLISDSKVSTSDIISSYNEDWEANKVKELILDRYKLTFYLKPKKNEKDNLPDWAEMFGNYIELDSLIRSNSLPGLIIIAEETEKLNPKKFVFSFGGGFKCLNQKNFMPGFGFKTASNSIGKEGIKEIGQQTRGSIPINAATSSKVPVNAFTIHLGSIYEEITYIKGNVDSFFSDQKVKEMYGKDTLHISVDTNDFIKDIPCILSWITERFEDDRYLKTFPIFNRQRTIKEPDEIKHLTNELVEKLKSDDLREITLSFSRKIFPCDKIQFGFRGKNGRYEKQDGEIDIKKVLENCKNQNEGEVSEKTLRETKIKIYNRDGNNPVTIDSWSILQAKISKDDESYYLLNNLWRYISNEVEIGINSYLEEHIEETDIGLKKYNKNFNSEEEYLESLTQSSDLHVSDSIIPYNKKGETDKVEFCDIIMKNNELIHLKLYRGAESMEALMSQALTSTSLLLHDSDFLSKIDSHLPEERRYNGQKPNSNDLKLIICLITKYRSFKELPLLSKIPIYDKLISLRELKVKTQFSIIEMEDSHHQDNQAA